MAIGVAEARGFRPLPAISHVGPEDHLYAGQGFTGPRKLSLYGNELPSLLLLTASGGQRPAPERCHR